MIDKILLQHYLDTKTELESIQAALFPEIRKLCELCTDIQDDDYIVDVHFEDNPSTLDELCVTVMVDNVDIGRYRYFFPARYLDMSRKAIAADVDKRSSSLLNTTKP